MSIRAKPTSSWFSIYSGQTCVGHVLSRGPKGFEAFDADDKSLGTFSTMQAAADACSGPHHDRHTDAASRTKAGGTSPAGAY